MLPKIITTVNNAIIFLFFQDCSVFVFEKRIADKLHNARSILADYHRGDTDIWSRFKGGKEGTLWYYRSLIEVSRQAGSNYLTEECDRIFKQLEQI